MENYFKKKKKISLKADKDKKGYWLSILDSSYFIDHETYFDFKTSKKTNLLGKISKYEPEIVKDIIKNELSFLELGDLFFN